MKRCRAQRHAFNNRRRRDIGLAEHVPSGTAVGGKPSPCRPIMRRNEGVGVYLRFCWRFFSSCKISHVFETREFGTQQELLW